MPEIQASFVYPFSHLLLGERATQFWGIILGPVSRQHPPANLFSEPLTVAKILPELLSREIHSVRKMLPH